MIEVTAAIICKDGKLLICQRPINKSCALLWEFPGGKIEPNETAEQCVVRECQEELNVVLHVIKKIAETTYAYPDRLVHLHFFLAEIVSGKLKKNEHKAVAWISPDEIKGYDFCPADAKMLSETDCFAAFRKPSGPL